MMPAKKRVLFVCIGNSCRSPLAEGVARAYGGDVLEAASAGLAPAMVVQPLTRKVMRDKNVPLDDEQFPLDIGLMDLSRFDLIVNLSGGEFPLTPPCPVVDWAVRDPIGKSEKVYQQVCDEIEMLVVRLVAELRRQV
jgi:arsenate reductase